MEYTVRIPGYTDEFAVVATTLKDAILSAAKQHGYVFKKQEIVVIEVFDEIGQCVQYHVSCKMEPVYYATRHYGS